MLLPFKGEERRRCRGDHCFAVTHEKSFGAAISDHNSFTSQEAYDAYLNSAAKSTLDQVCAQQNLLQEPQREQRLIPAAGFPLRSPGLRLASGNHVALAKIDYVSGTRDEGIQHWSSVAAFVKESEEGTHTYWFLADPEDEDVLYTLERYRDEKYLWDTHVPSSAIQENKNKQKDIRTGLLLRGFESVE